MDFVGYFLAPLWGLFRRPRPVTPAEAAWELLRNRGEVPRGTSAPSLQEATPDGWRDVPRGTSWPPAGSARVGHEPRLRLWPRLYDPERP